MYKIHTYMQMYTPPPVSQFLPFWGGQGCVAWVDQISSPPFLQPSPFLFFKTVENHCPLQPTRQLPYVQETVHMFYFI